MTINDLQVLILAGGLGTRLRPATLNTPKPMIKVIDKPYLEHQILLLRQNGASRFLMLTGYLGRQISDYFGDGRKWDVHIQYSQEPEPLGTAGAIQMASSLLENIFLLLNGDSYLPINYRDFLDRYLETNFTGMLSIYDNKIQETNVPGNVVLDNSGRIVEYRRSGHDNGTTFIDAGASLWKKQLLSFFPKKSPLSLEQDIFPSLIKQGRLGSYPINERFYDMGTPDRLQEFTQFLLTKKTLK
ncbi:MAG: NTP transferase domain-containing protein [Elusimicrobia bacterium]|nr:NTP transferase domain-containing protein [Elusimicrobiota bacterium]